MKESSAWLQLTGVEGVIIAGLFPELKWIPAVKEISMLLSCSSSHCLSNMLLLGYLCFKIHYREYCITVMKGLPGHLSTYLRHVTRFAAFEADCSHLIKTSTGPAHISLYQHCTISNGVIPWITRYQRLVHQRDQSRWDFFSMHRNSTLHSPLFLMLFIVQSPE